MHLTKLKALISFLVKLLKIKFFEKKGYMGSFLSLRTNFIKTLANLLADKTATFLQVSVICNFNLLKKFLVFENNFCLSFKTRKEKNRLFILKGKIC